MRGLLSQASSFLIAFVFATILWAIATSEENPSREANFPDALPVQILNAPEQLAVFQKSADTVRVKIRAPLAMWDQLRAESLRAVLDLRNASVGINPIEVRVQVADSRVNVVAIEPPVINVRLDRLTARDFKIQVELSDAPPTGYENKSPVVNPTRAQVSGPAELMDQVARVDADVSLRGARTTLETSVALVARDARGNIVTGVSILPSQVSVIVPVDQRVGYKDVSVKTILKGAVAGGYWISNIVVAPSTATVVGSAEQLAKLPGFIETTPIDVNAATSDVIKTVPLTLPDGIAMLDNNGVTVQISITPILGGQTIRRLVQAQGLRRGIVATVSPDAVEVILSGPMPALADLSSQDVQIIIDATGLAPGVYVLKPRAIIVPSVLRVQSLLPDTVLVNLTEATQK